MNAEDEIEWVTLTFDFSPDQETWLEARAKTEGLPIKCFCFHVLLKHLSEEPETEQWQKKLAATLRRNGCHDEAKVGPFKTISQ